jgi:hypothetical protein
VIWFRLPPPTVDPEDLRAIGRVLLGFACVNACLLLAGAIGVLWIVYR